MSNKRHHVNLITQEILRVLGALCHKWEEDQIYIYYYNSHNTIYHITAQGLELRNRRHHWPGSQVKTRWSEGIQCKLMEIMPPPFNSLVKNPEVGACFISLPTACLSYGQADQGLTMTQPSQGGGNEQASIMPRQLQVGTQLPDEDIENEAT